MNKSYLHVRINDDLIKALKDMAEASEGTMRGIISRLIREEYAKFIKKSNNP